MTSEYQYVIYPKQSRYVWNKMAVDCDFITIKQRRKKQQHFHIKHDNEAGVCNWKHVLKHCPVDLTNDIKKLFEICTHWHDIRNSRTLWRQHPSNILSFFYSIDQ